MIAQVTGKVVHLGLTSTVVEVGGVGLAVLMPPGTGAKLALGATVTLHTTLVVRETELTLYGFIDPVERDEFELVQTATGVGPKLALSIVSVLPPTKLRDAVLREDLAALCTVPGVGRKGAQRLVLELKDKVTGLAEGAEPTPATTSDAAWREQVADGLQSLGWSARDAETACDRVAHLVDEGETSVAVLLRAALQSLARA